MGKREYVAPNGGATIAIPFGGRIPSVMATGSTLTVFSLNNAAYGFNNYYLDTGRFKDPSDLFFNCRREGLYMAGATCNIQFSTPPSSGSIDFNIRNNGTVPYARWKRMVNGESDIWISIAGVNFSTIGDIIEFYFDNTTDQNFDVVNLQAWAVAL